MKAKKRGCELPKGRGRMRSPTAARTCSIGSPVSGSGSSNDEAAAPTLPNTGRLVEARAVLGREVHGRVAQPPHCFSIQIEVVHGLLP